MSASEVQGKPEAPTAADTVRQWAVLISAIVVAVISLFAASLYRSAAANVEASRPEPRYSPEMNQAREDWAAQLNDEPHWEIRSADERALVIPIDMAA